MKKAAPALLSAVLLPAVLLLAACDSAKEASTRNFEKAINAHFARTCVNITPTSLGGSWHAPYWPVIIETNADKRSARNSYEPLVKAGLLTVTDGTARPNTTLPLDARNSQNATVPAKIYSLTEAGKKAYVNPVRYDNGGFCVAHYKVDKIVRFTQPVNTGGATVTQVSYTFSPTDVAQWAKSSDVAHAYTELEDKLAAHQSDVTTLVLANDGWIEINDFAPSASAR